MSEPISVSRLPIRKSSQRDRHAAECGSGPLGWDGIRPGEVIKIKASKKVAFRVAKELKEVA